jgi:hypothetical protein
MQEQYHCLDFQGCKPEALILAGGNGHLGKHKLQVRMAYQTTDVHGITRLMPDHECMVRMVHELYSNQKDDFADVVLTHRSGIAISLHANGCAVLEQPHEEEDKMLRDLSRDEQLTLWIQLAAGNLARIQALEWEPMP